MAPELEAAELLYAIAPELVVAKLLYFVASELLSPIMSELEARMITRIELVGAAITIGVATIGVANTIEVIAIIGVALITSILGIVAGVAVTFSRAKRVISLKKKLKITGVSSNSVAYLGKFGIRLFHISVSIGLRYL